MPTTFHGTQREASQELHGGGLPATFANDPHPMATPSWIQIIDATYRIDGDDTSWLDGIVETMRPTMDQGLGLYAYLYHAPDPARFQAAHPIRFYGCSEEIKVVARRALEVTTPEIVRDVLLSHPAGTTSDVLGRRRWNKYRKMFSDKVADSLGVSAVDPTGHGCLIIAPMTQMHRLSQQHLSRWAKISAHIASGYRLRRTLRSRHTSPLQSAEAVIDGGGRIQHAVARATEAEARAALRRAAENIDRARTLRRRDSEDALELWTALVDGSWSMIEHFDSDGRRFFVACRNNPAVRLHRRLTRRELTVATYASFGHSNKFIAYELGLSVSTVATHLSTAATKLGLRSRPALIDLVRRLAPAAGQDATSRLTSVHSTPTK